MYREQAVSKKIHPHINEFKRLGKYHTEEGKEYSRRYREIIMYEMTDILDIEHERKFFGGSKNIHCS